MMPFETTGAATAQAGYLIAIMLAGLVAMASPGPATFAISQTAMARGRNPGLMIATGVATGSIIWCVVAAAGLGAVLLSLPWLQQVLRYVAGAYLLFLAIKSARSALSKSGTAKPVNVQKPGRTYLSGLAIHLTNPKPVIFYGALFSAGLPHGAGAAALISVAFILCVQSLVVFNALAFFFSWPRMAQGYARLRRFLEAGFAAFFGFAALRLLSAPLRS